MGLTHQVKDLKSGKFKDKHGLSRSRIYSTWLSMKERCNNEKNKSYKNYGAKGIKVCDEWQNDFIKFYDFALQNGYKDNLTIDRIDNKLGYFPQNCRFVTVSEQNRNYNKNHLITYKGETLCLSDMADKYGVNRATVLFRIKQGKPLDIVFSNKDFRYNK